jgi:hypothetical protein
MSADLFKDKEVAKVHLFDNAVINSRLLADDGSVLRQYHLKSQKITYDARSRHLTIPAPGQMLVEIHDPAGDGAEAKPAKAGDEAALAGGNGITAFEWHEGLEHDEAAGRAVMSGSVVVSHQPDKKNEPPVRLDAETVTATFAAKDAGKAAGEAEKAAASGEQFGPAKLQLHSMSARGSVVISRQGAELGANEITYDPAGQWVIARGTDRNPATFSAPGGTGTTRAGELWLNTKTWAVKVRDVNIRAGGPLR